jgi:hypothetical protein
MKAMSDVVTLKLAKNLHLGGQAAFESCPHPKRFPAV